MARKKRVNEVCAICECPLHRSGNYASDSGGRDHATSSHFVAERFFGRSSNRRGTVTTSLFKEGPWNVEGQSAVMCYECHEIMLHNPVILPDDIRRFAEIVRRRGLNETEKTEDRSKLIGRIRLFQEVIALGIQAVLAEADSKYALLSAAPQVESGLM